MKKLLAGGTLAVLAFGGMIATAAPASAHTPAAGSGCGWVQVDLKAYRDAKVTVVIDGNTAYEDEFSGQFFKKFEGLALDKPHEWTVTVDAYDGHNGTQYDWSKSGAIDVCEKPAPTPTPTPEPTPSEPVVEPTPEPSEPAVEPTPEPSEPAVEPTPEPSEPAVEPSEDASVAPVAPVDEPSPSPSSDEPPVLAATGATVGGAIGFAALLAAGGVALVWARKRMQNA
ncbi:hypothetical protein [Promicromonospora iranensis]|uniref:hypothetical protein n=1 Tax=Promicromonospora iranensis TaxID=1105144 RepID=UPI0023A933E6|nr:hypothetical protein [Promicromonospora iranensis]